MPPIPCFILAFNNIYTLIIHKNIYILVFISTQEYAPYFTMHCYYIYLPINNKYVLLIDSINILYIPFFEISNI